MGHLGVGPAEVERQAGEVVERRELPVGEVAGEAQSLGVQHRQRPIGVADLPCAHHSCIKLSSCWALGI